MWFMVLIWELTPPEDSPRAGGEKRSARCSDAAVYSGDPVTSLFIGPGLLSGCKITYHSHVCQSYWQNEPAQEAQRTRTPQEASPVCWWLSPCAGDVSWDSKRSVLTHAVSYCNVTRWSSKYFTDPCDFSGLIRVSIFCSFFFFSEKHRHQQQGELLGKLRDSSLSSPTTSKCTNVNNSRGTVHQEQCLTVTKEQRRNKQNAKKQDMMKAQKTKINNYK